MPISTTYTITNTQGSLSFQMTAGSANGPNELAQSTDLTFYGYGRTGWGQQVDQNFYSLLENFACAQLPGPVPSTKTQLGGTLGINDPVIGQQWFNLTNSEMYVCVNSGTNTWYHLLSETYADTKYLTIADASGTGTNAFLKLNGSNSPMTGPLILDADPTGLSNPQTAATRNYVDTAVNTLTATINGPSGFVHKTGDTMTGTLVVSTATASDGFTDISVATNAPTLLMGRYGTAANSNLRFITSGSTSGSPTIDSSIVASGGTVGSAGQGTITVTGFLVSDGRTPTLANQVVTKSWTENLINTAISNLSGSVNTTYVKKSGDTMSGQLNMGGNRVTNIGYPAVATDAARVDWVRAQAYMPTGLGGAHQIWISGAGPSGGASGDIWIRY